MTTPTSEPAQQAKARGSIASTIGSFLIFALCFLASWYPLDNSSDFWAHAAVGRWIAEHGQVPHHALFLWTSHARWIAHSWLSELVIYEMLHSLGDGIGSVVALLSTAAFAFVAFGAIWRLSDIRLATLGPALPLYTAAIYCASGRFFPRPEVVSLALLAVLLSLLIRRDTTLAEAKQLNHESSPAEGHLAMTFIVVDRRLAISLPILFILWTNLHGAMLTGLITLWIYAIGGLIQDRASAYARRFALIAAACTVSTLVNPYGYHYYAIYRSVQTVTFKNIVEWRPLLAHPPVPPIMLAMLAGVIVTAVVAWVRAPLSLEGRGAGGERCRRWTHLLWLVAFVILTLEARRNIGYLCIVALAVGAPYFASRAGDTPRRMLPAATAALWWRGRGRWASLVAAISVYGFAACTAFAGLGPMPLQSLSVDLAGQSCAFIEQNHLAVRPLNDYDTASYLEWRLADDHSFFVDGLNAYPDSVYVAYHRLLDAPGGLTVLDRLGVDCIVGRGHLSGKPDFPRIYLEASQSPQWALAYYGHDGPIWIRRRADNRDLWQDVGTFTGRTYPDFWTYLHTAHFVGQ